MKRNSSSAASLRIYRYPDLKPAGVSYTFKHVTTLEKRDEFPKRVHLGRNSVGWVGAEVDQWVEDRIRQRQPRVSAQEAEIVVDAAGDPLAGSKKIELAEQAQLGDCHKQQPKSSNSGRFPLGVASATANQSDPPSQARASITPTVHLNSGLLIGKLRSNSRFSEPQATPKAARGG
jgi:prophage regulatory protein